MLSVAALASRARTSSSSSSGTENTYVLKEASSKKLTKQYLRDNPEIAAKLESDIRRDFHKLMSNQSRIAAKAAGRAVDVSADDFKDED